MHRVSSVDVMSVAKTVAVIYGAMSLIVVPFILVAGLVGSFSASDVSRAWGVSMSLVVVIAVPILDALAGFIIGAIGAAAYNVVASRYGGGIVVDLEAIAPPVLLPGAGAQSQA